MERHPQPGPRETIPPAGYPRRYRALAIALAALAAVALVVVAYLTYVRASFGTFAAFGPPDRIEYHGRRYYASHFGDRLPQIHLDVIRESRPAGEFVGPLLNRLEVYELAKAGSKQTHTVLYLKQRDGKFLVYVLSGGP